jgi:protein ImuB
VATDPPDGIFIDIAGAPHLFKGETALLQDLKNRMAASKIASRVAVADTPGCAWAVARYGKEEIVAPGWASEWLGSLPVRALRLAPATVESLRDVGIERIAQLASKPRASLQPRFGSELLLRMDQSAAARSGFHAGRQYRPGRADRHLAPQSQRRASCQTACGKAGAGRSRLWHRGSHPHRLLDRGADRTPDCRRACGEGRSADVGELVDRLRVKLGAERVFRVEPVESDVPERATKRVAAMAEAKGVSWPDDLPRPSRLLTPPELVNAMAEVPDAAPRFFVWRKTRHRIVKADGPERILGEWWVSEKDIGLQRDYRRVENIQGERFWLFRDAPAEQGGRWWLHGIGDA